MTALWERLDEYAKVHDAAWAEYAKVRAAAGAECAKVNDAAWAEYAKVRDAAWAEYAKVRDAAWAEYDRVCDAAWAECRKVRDAAWAAIDDGSDPLVTWIVANCGEWRDGAVEVMRLLPCALADIEAYAADVEWCSKFGELRDAAVAAGVVG